MGQISLRWYWIAASLTPFDAHRPQSKIFPLHQEKFTDGTFHEPQPGRARDRVAGLEVWRRQKNRKRKPETQVN